MEWLVSLKQEDVGKFSISLRKIPPVLLLLLLLLLFLAKHKNRVREEARDEGSTKINKIEREREREISCNRNFSQNKMEQNFIIISSTVFCFHFFSSIFLFEMRSHDGKAVPKFESFLFRCCHLNIIKKQQQLTQ